MKITPLILKFGLNFFGPYLGAGIKITKIKKNWQSMEVIMKLRWFNKNIVGTHFGGSLYSMVDPHLMLMLMQILGKDYYVWDHSATIDFIRPGKGTVRSTLSILDSDLSEIYAKTEHGKKYLHNFNVNVIDSQGEVVAQIKKILYVKKKPEKTK